VAYVVLVCLVLFLGLYLGAVFRRRGRGIVARRGMSIGADLGMLADAARVQIRGLTQTGSDRVRLVLSPALDPTGDPPQPPDVELVVLLSADEFGFEVLNEWKRSEAWIAIVTPPSSRIVRLRSVDSLQPLTLRRAD
jgi:hypothetical protein